MTIGVEIVVSYRLNKLKLCRDNKALAFGIITACVCVSVCLCVYLCVVQSRSFPCNDSSPVEGRVIKFGLEMQNTLFKMRIVFWVDWPPPSRSHLTWGSNLTTFWNHPHHNKSPVQTRITTFGPEVQIPWLWSILFWGAIGAEGISLLNVALVLSDLSNWHFSSAQGRLLRDKRIVCTDAVPSFTNSENCYSTDGRIFWPKNILLTWM